MKNVQIIDGAENCSFSICAIPEREFQRLFPGENQDVEFIEDSVERLGEGAVGSIMKLAKQEVLNKAEVKGIHGTLFIGLPERRAFYPNRRAADVDQSPIQGKAIATPMRWFWAWTLLMTSKKKDSAKPRAMAEVWKNLIVVRALTAEEAWDNACAIAKRSEGDDDGGLTLWGSPATTEFLGISDFGVVHDQLGDGAEILWQQRRCSRKTARTLARKKAQVCAEVAAELGGRIT